MKRRPFLRTAAGTAAVLAGSTASYGAVKSAAATGSGTLAGMTLEKLRDRYVPFSTMNSSRSRTVCNRHRIRRLHVCGRPGRDTAPHRQGLLYPAGESGPYRICTTTWRKTSATVRWRGGRSSSSSKRKPSGDAMWPRSMTRTGETKSQPTDRDLRDMFQSRRVSPNSRKRPRGAVREIAREIMRKSSGLYDRPDYQPESAGDLSGPDAKTDARGADRRGVDGVHLSHHPTAGTGSGMRRRRRCRTKYRRPDEPSLQSGFGLNENRQP